MKTKRVLLILAMCVCMVLCSIGAAAVEDDGLSRLDNTSGQNVGDVADFGWNANNANYTIKEIADGIVWYGTNDPTVFHETWFWTKEGDNFLNDWTWTVYVKPVVDTQGGCFVQLMFGTSAVGGRYSLLIDPAGGGYVQLYRGGMIANSWEESMGATMKLGTGKEVELAVNQAVKVSIYHKAQDDGTGYVTVCLNDIRVMETAIDNAAAGDYGLWLDAGMDAWFGNSVVTKGSTVVDNSSGDSNEPATGETEPAAGDGGSDAGDDIPKTGDFYVVAALVLCVAGFTGWTMVKLNKKSMV